MKYREMIELLREANSVEEIDMHRDDIAQIIPQVKSMFDYDQKNHAHQYDLWMHSLHTVIGLPRNLDDDMIYLAALIHDIGKPCCQVKGTSEGDTNMHYYGHPEYSAQIVQDEILPGLYSQGIDIFFWDQMRLMYYVSNHDDHVSLDIKHLKKHLKDVSIDVFKMLMLLQVADAKAHIQLPIIAERVKICEKLSGPYADELKEIIDSHK